MAYLKLNNVDFSSYTNELEVSDTVNYNAQTNAAGNTVVDYINRKKTIRVGIIPINNSVMKQLKAVLDAFSVSATYLNPNTGALDTINCIIPASSVKYYTIQANKVMFEAFTFELLEL